MAITRISRSANPSLTPAPESDTLAGGRGGHSPSPEGTADTSVTDVAAQSMKDALAALTVMFCGYLDLDRELLDHGFEDLVGILEEWRDAVPKA